MMLATRDARSCKGKVIWLKTMAGMGIIISRNAKGKRTARRKDHPANNTIKPARTTNKEKRERKISAPSCPKTRRDKPNARMRAPHQEGRSGMRDSRVRSCQMTKPAKRGTKKPWEKLGSCHHWLTKWVRVIE